MANYTEIFEKKLDWQMPFQRTGKFPLDRSAIFGSYQDAVKYAAGNKDNPDSRGLQGTSYVGQIITVFENDIVTVYQIEANRTLKEVGAATLGDGKSIDLGDGNVLSLKNFGKKYYKYVVVLPAVATVQELPADAAKGSYCKVGASWYVKNDSWGAATQFPVEGTNYILVDDGTFPAGLQPKTRLAEDGTIELAWYEPSSTTVEGLAEQMSSLTETVNTVQQVASEAARAIEEDVVHKETGKGLSTNDYTDAEKNKLKDIENNAQVNVIESIKVKKGETTETLQVTEKSVTFEVPTKVSDLTNDKEFIDNTVNNLLNYYTKGNTYNKAEVDNLIAAVAHLKLLKVDVLPTENISTSTIYLVLNNRSETNDIYDEYIYVDGSWELIGDTRLDLSNYLQKDGDGSDVTVAFTAAGTRELPITGETLATIIGKVVKYLTDLKTVAFTGSYNDLTDKPETVTRSVVTLAKGATSATFTGTNIIAITAYDATTKEVVLVDQTITATGASISITEAYTNDITIVVATLN